MIDDAVRNRKISMLQNNILYLKEIQSVNTDDFINNFEKKYATRHVVQECIQICIDIAFHLCLINGIGDPNNYKDAFKKLGDFKIITQTLAENLSQWTGLRNIITHIYEKIDDKLILSSIKQNLDDFENFIQQVAQLKKKNKRKKN